MIRLFFMFALIFQFSAPEVSYAGDAASMTRKEKRKAKMAKRVAKTMKKHGLPVGSEDAARDILIRQAVYTRSTGRALVGTGSTFFVLGSATVGGGLMFMASEGGLGGVLIGGVVASCGIILQVIGVGQLIPGLVVREDGKRMLRDLDLNPKIKTKKALDMVSVSPVFHRDYKGLRLAVKF